MTEGKREELGKLLEWANAELKGRYAAAADASVGRLLCREMASLMLCLQMAELAERALDSNVELEQEAVKTKQASNKGKGKKNTTQNSNAKGVGPTSESLNDCD